MTGPRTAEDLRRDGRTERQGRVVAVTATQLVAVALYVAFWLEPGGPRSELGAAAEYYSFYVAPFLWVALWVAGLRQLRRPLSRRASTMVRVAALLSGLCALAATAVAVGLVQALLVADGS